MINSRMAINHAAIAAAALFAVLCAANGSAQQTEDTVVRTHITVTQADIEAAANVRFSSYHVMAANVPGAKQRVATLNAANARRVAERNGRAAEPVPAAVTWTNPHFYPADVQSGGGKTVATAVHHAVYVDYKGTVAANWGDPEGYLTHLFADPFIHLTDQYTKSTAASPFSLGQNMSATYSYYGNVLDEHDLWAIVHSAASAKGFGAGLGQIYHLFLPNGTDTCFEETGDCYSPDNFLAWTFCGYHDYVEFKDIGAVLFTVQPYQNVDGCAVHTPSPNGILVDSTDSTLSHEVFETITDPEPDSGFTNELTLDLQGYEISDECQPLVDDNGNFLVPTSKIDGKKYAVQLEYSNFYHACAAQP